MLVVTQRSVYEVSFQNDKFLLKKAANTPAGMQSAGAYSRVPTPLVGREFVGASIELRLGGPMVLSDRHGKVIVRSTPVTRIDI